MLGGLNYYTYSTLNTQLSEQKATMAAQVSGLQSTISILQDQLIHAQQAETNDASQISSLQSGLSSVSAQLSNVVNELSSTQSGDLAFQGRISAQLQNITSSVDVLSAKLSSLFPQAPQSTLTVTGSSYNNSTSTYSFSVRNGQAYTVYAQLSASFFGNPCNFYAGEGSYMSQVYAFAPNATLTIPLNLKGIAFIPSSFCGKEPIAYFQLDFVASATVVSPTYTFQVNPPYQF